MTLRRVLHSGRLAIIPFFLVLVGCQEPVVDDENERPVVETLVVRPGAFEEWIETTGRVEALNDALLTAETAGTVVAVAQEGRRVERGQIVLQTDAEQAIAAVERSSAQVAEAQAAVSQAEEEVQRIAPLARDTIVSPLEFDQVRTRERQARAGLQQALAARREAEQALEQTRTRAPFSGVVEERWVRAGEQVNPGQEVLRIVGPGTMEVQAGIPERFAGDIEVGSPAQIRLHAYGLDQWKASVTSVGRAVDLQSRTFPVRIVLTDRSADAIKADMIASVRIVRRILDEVLIVPPGAVQRDERGESVLVAAGADTVRVLERRSVQLGARSEEGVVVQGGLDAGDEIVVAGLATAVAGDTVEVTRRYMGIEGYRRALEEEMDAAADPQRSPTAPVP